MNETDLEGTDSNVKIFHRINRLREKAGGSRHEGGNARLSRKVMDQARLVIAQEASEYPEKAADDLDLLIAITSELMDATPEKQPKILDRLSKAANTIQSFGATFEYKLLTVFGRSLRRYTETIKNADSNQLTLIQAHVDAINVVITQKITGDGGEVGKALISDIQVALEKYGGSTVADEMNYDLEDL